MTLRTRVVILFEKVGNGTCWFDGGMQESFAPYHIVKRRTLGTCCCSCCFAKNWGHDAHDFLVSRLNDFDGVLTYLVECGDSPCRVVTAQTSI